MKPSSHTSGRLHVIFDDDHAVANAGLLLTGTLAERLGLEDIFDEAVDLGDRPGGANPGRKVLTLAHAIVAGGDCISDADVLRAGATGQVLPHRVAAPSTVGTFLRSFTFGHVRQLDKASEAALGRAWAAGAGPGDAPVTIDLDSTVCEVHGYRKGGVAYGYTRQLGYHPLLATREGTGEVLHARQRKGSAHTARGAAPFLAETVGRVRRAGATGELTVRADSGFWSKGLLERCRALGVAFSVTVRQTPQVKEAIASIDESAWEEIDYPDGGEAQVAETPWRGDRLVVRRTRILGPQGQLFPDWRYHAFVTDRQGEAISLDADHRRHAVMELAIRDLKEGAGMNHCPSGRFFANAAWLAIAALAHNLLRWVGRLGLKIEGLVVAKTIRRKMLAVPGRITRSARRLLLHMPTAWPWRGQFLAALIALRAIPLLH